MRPFFVFLGLLLCLITTRAEEQRVIEDSESSRFVGRYIEVCGLVVSVTSSPLGTTFINFGREYPNQTFAGFIPADSGEAGDQNHVDVSDRRLKFQVGGMMGTST